MRSIRGREALVAQGLTLVPDEPYVADDFLIDMVSEQTTVGHSRRVVGCAQRKINRVRGPSQYFLRRLVRWLVGDGMPLTTVAGSSYQAIAETPKGTGFRKRQPNLLGGTHRNAQPRPLGHYRHRNSTRLCHGWVNKQAAVRRRARRGCGVRPAPPEDRDTAGLPRDR